MISSLSTSSLPSISLLTDQVTAFLISRSNLSTSNSWTWLSRGRPSSLERKNLTIYKNNLRPSKSNTKENSLPHSPKRTSILIKTTMLANLQETPKILYTLPIKPIYRDSKPKVHLSHTKRWTQETNLNLAQKDKPKEQEMREAGAQTRQLPNSSQQRLGLKCPKIQFVWLR